MFSQDDTIHKTPPRLSRAQVVQAFADLYPAARYLEIGVCTGATFHAVQASKKVAVDPHFQFDLIEARSTQPQAVYHQVPSDTFFLDILEKSEKFDVIFIDGLHTYEQTLKDFFNAIACLAEGGVIVIDDVKPIDYASSLPDQSGAQAVRAALGETDERWMGDVYKLVFFIAGYLGTVTFATVRETYGQLIVWREVRPTVSDLSLEAIARLQFCDVVARMDTYRLKPLDEIVQLFRGSSERTA